MLSGVTSYAPVPLLAEMTRETDHKFKFTLGVESHKMKSDGSGNETPMKVNDLVDIGVFVGQKEQEKPLYLQKHWLRDGKQTFEVVVDQMPSRAGIDPLNKLIDRNGDNKERCLEVAHEWRAFPRSNLRP